MADKKSLDEMRDEAYRRQDNLAADIDELLDRVNPKNAVTRWKNELVGSIKDFSAADDGKTPALPVAVAGGVIGVVLIGAGIAAAVALSGRREDPEEASAQRAAERLQERRKAQKKN